MFIKICGMTSESAVVAAIECGVDAIGFVFAPSARRVTPQRAAELSAQAPRDLLRIAVTCHPEQRLVDEIVRYLEPDYLQTDIDDLETLELPADLHVLPVLRSDEPDPATLPPRLLFEAPVSGRGIGTNWQRAALLAKRTELILAGGLHSGNVVEAIRCVQPFGVDVSSGVESTRGVKDARRMAEFVTAVRSSDEANLRGGQRESRSG
jgi:phosphoribosylanthranilate isomerase